MTVNDFSFTSGFWNIWITVLTVGNILACWWLIRWTAKPQKGEAATGDVTGHSWDGIQEFNNPLPRWWLWTFYLTILWGIGYTLAYPSWPGLNAFYSQRSPFRK